MYLEMKDVTKRIRGTTVVDKVGFTMEKGRVYGLWGKNGSGKTMILRLLAGLILPSEGEIRIDGKCLGKDMDFPESLGLLIENPSFISYETGFQNLAYLAHIRKRVSDQQIRETLEAVGLDPDDRRTFRKYSLGMKQRLGIAAAIMEKPELLLLDEPFNALDTKGVAQVKALLKAMKAEGTLIVLACHDREEMEELADEVFLIEEGRITGHESVDKKG